MLNSGGERTPSCGTPVLNWRCLEVWFSIEWYSDSSRRGSHLVRPFTTVLFCVCSAVTVECFVLYPCCMGVFAVMYGRRLFSSVFTKSRDMGLYEVPLSVSWLGFGIGTLLANFHVWGIMFLLRAVLNILVRNANPRGPMCFRCLIFSLSWPCELLFLLCFITSWTWVVVSVMLYSCMFCVALSMDLFFCMLRVCELFRETIRNMFGCVCNWVWWSFWVWLEVLYWIYHVWSSIECVCSACGPSERLDSPSIGCLCFCMSEVNSSFIRLRAGSQVFALLMLFLCVILHTMSSGKSLQLLCIFSFGMLAVCI